MTINFFLRKILLFQIEKDKRPPGSYFDWYKTKLLPFMVREISQPFSLWKLNIVQVTYYRTELRTFTLKSRIPDILVALSRVPFNPYVQPCRNNWRSFQNKKKETENRNL